MSTSEMSRVSGTSSDIEDEPIDVDSDQTPINNDCHRCQHHHHQQQHHRHGNQLQQPRCIQLRLPYPDRPRLTESEERIRKRSIDKGIAQSPSDLESPSKYVTCSTTELRSLLSLTAQDPISSEKRVFSSPPSVRSLSSGASSSSSSSSSSAVSSPPSSPPHKKHQRPPTVPSLDASSPLITKSTAAFQQRRPSCPSNVSIAAVPRCAPAPVTNFFIEEILKPSFGVSSKSTKGFGSTWGRPCAPEDRLQGLSPDLLIRSELPIRPGMPSQKYEQFPISRVNAQEPEEVPVRNHVTKKRKQSKPSEDMISLDLRHKVDLGKDDGKLSSRVIGSLNTTNIGVTLRGQSPNGKSSSRYQVLPLLIEPSRSQAVPPLQTESSAFKLVTCNASSAANDLSNCSSSNASSQASLPEDNGKSEESDEHLHPSDPSSASSGSSSCFQAQQLPAWVFCTRYSDRPSSGPRSRKVRPRADSAAVDDKRPRTAFTNDQLQILKREFSANQYLNEDRRHALAAKLNLNETQIKIWFQNKRAKLKKASGTRNRLALELMAQGLYNHSTMTATGECG